MRPRGTDVLIVLLLALFYAAFVYVLARAGAFDEPDPRTWPRIPWPDAGTR